MREKALYRAILNRAILDILPQSSFVGEGWGNKENYAEAERQEQIRSAKAWLFETRKRPEIVSFESCCEILDLDKNLIISRVKKLIESGEEVSARRPRMS